MIRHLRTLWLPALLLLLAACDDSTGPDSFSISGTWNSVGLPGEEFGMTVVETARAVEGAGRRVSAGSATAYAVLGANTGQTVSLLFDFDEAPDITFEGGFARGPGRLQQLTGQLFGGGFNGEEVTFQRSAS